MNQRRFFSVALGIAVFALVGTSLAFRRTTTSNGRFDLWWGTRQLSVVVNDFSSKGASNVCGVGVSNQETFYRAVTNSFEAWAQAGTTSSGERCTDITFTVNSTSSTNTGNDKQNIVVVRQGQCDEVISGGCGGDPDPEDCADENNCWDSSDSHHEGRLIIALTSVFHNTTTGQIVDVDMELNGRHGDPEDNSGQYFTCIDPPSSSTGDPLDQCPSGVSIPEPVCTCVYYGHGNCIAMDVQNTVTHEAGHFLGLAHPCESEINGSPQCTESDDSTPTMYPKAALGETKKRTLERDDINGICTVYPQGKPTPKSSRFSDGGGCGSGAADLLGLLAVLGLLAIRRSGYAHARQ